MSVGTYTDLLKIKMIYYVELPLKEERPTSLTGVGLFRDYYYLERIFILTKSLIVALAYCCSINLCNLVLSILISSISLPSLINNCSKVSGLTANEPISSLIVYQTFLPIHF
jgi:hypothetical protein